MIDELQDLNQSHREIAFAFAELDDSAPLIAREVTEHLLNRRELSRGTVDRGVRDLVELGVLDDVGKRETPGRGEHPTAFRITDEGYRTLVELVERRADQLRRDPLGGWSPIGTQEDLGGSRLVEDPFCPDCRSVWAGEGPCPDCREAPVDAALADGGERP